MRPIEIPGPTPRRSWWSENWKPATVIGFMVLVLVGSLLWLG